MNMRKEKQLASFFFFHNLLTHYENKRHLPEKPCRNEPINPLIHAWKIRIDMYSHLAKETKTLRRNVAVLSPRHCLPDDMRHEVSTSMSKRQSTIATGSRGGTRAKRNYFLHSTPLHAAYATLTPLHIRRDVQNVRWLCFSAG